MVSSGFRSVATFLSAALASWSTSVCNARIAGSALGRQAAAAGWNASAHDSNSRGMIPAIPASGSTPARPLRITHDRWEITGFPAWVRYLMSRFSKFRGCGARCATRAPADCDPGRSASAVLRT